MGSHGKATHILIDSWDVSAAMDASDETRETQAAETTGYRPTGDARTYIPGLHMGTFSFSGFYEAVPAGAANLLDDAFESFRASAAGQIITRALQGFAIGNRVSMLLSRDTSYQKTSPKDDVVKVSAQFQADGGVDGGVSLHALTEETSTGSGASVDNGAASANGGVAHLHVTARSGTPTGTFKVRHSTDDAVYTDLVTFAALGDEVGSERVVVAQGTTVNRYVKGDWTLGGSTPGYTFALAFARR